MGIRTKTDWRYDDEVRPDDLNRIEGNTSQLDRKKVDQEEHNVLKTRVDNLLSLPHGSTTGDAELSDLRVGANGEIYKTAGEATREQFKKASSKIGELKEDLADLSVVTKVDFSVYEDKNYLSITGGIASNANNFGLIKKVFLPAYSKIKLIAGGYNTNVCMIGKYVNDTKYNPLVICTQTNVKEYEYTATEDMYIGISFRIDLEHSAKITVDVLEKFNSKADTSSLENLTNNEIKNFTWIDNYYIDYRNGAVSSSNGYKCTDYKEIPYKLNGNTSITVISACKNDISGIAFYDGNKNYVGGSSLGASASDYEVAKNIIYIPINAHYFRFTCGKYLTDKAKVIIKNDITDLLNNTNEISNLVITGIFSRILCIGDSLTQGAYYINGWSGNSVRKNYPSMLGRMCNTPVDNAGYSGISPKGWYETQKLSDYSKYDLVIMWLGTNNGLSDTLDTDVTPYDDYNDYANTETGCYCKIIEDIKKTSPNAFIVLANVFASSGDKDTTNIVIDKIAQKYNLNVIDMTNFGVSNRLYHGDVDNVHFSVFGNWCITKKFVYEISKMIMSDYTIADKMPDITLTNWVNTVRPTN